MRAALAASTGLFAALTCALLTARTARAQDVNIPVTVTQAPAPYFSNGWSEGRARLFFAGSAALGSAARTELSIGYGKPHWTWVGVESTGVSTGEYALTQVRARLALVIADIAIGWGRVWSYRHTTLPRFSRTRDLTVAERDVSRYRTLQVWLSGVLPGPHGFIDWQLEGVRVYGVADGDAVYDEQLRAVLFPTWAFAGRLGYAYQFSHKRGAVGALGEAVWPGDRGDYVARVGPVFSWAFSPRLDLALIATAVVHSPDRLGFYQGMGGTARARYRFASGAR